MGPSAVRLRFVPPVPTSQNAPSAATVPSVVSTQSESSVAASIVDDVGGRLSTVLSARIEGLHRLSGGASRETWSFDSVDVRSHERRELILRRDPVALPGEAGPGKRDGMELEARLLAAAARAAVPVPTVRAAGPADERRLQSSFLIMDRIGGETIARKILRDDQFAMARSVLTAQCGEALSKLHRIDPDTIKGLEPSDELAKYREVHDLIGRPSPVFELAFRWLADNQPATQSTCVVHGDFRLGNLIIDDDGLVAVLDWELAHLGDPMEDLAWLCVRAWRFGGPHPVAGVGSYEELFTAYEAAGGANVDRVAFRWWEVLSTLKWGVMCETQANAHLSGALKSVELAAIGRRVCEQEHDLLELLFPTELTAALGSSAAATSGPEAVAVTRVDPIADLHGEPTVLQLIEAVRGYLERDVVPGVAGRVGFHGRVAANVLAMVERELATTPYDAARQELRLAEFGVSSRAELAAALRSGALSEATSGLVDALAEMTVSRLRVANPKYAR
jgi:aminoglycoside phosphotransferase (APT) family kinase protein